MNKYIRRAAYLMKNKTRIQEVTREALGLVTSKRKLGQVKGEVLLMIDLIHDAVFGKYKGWSKKNVILALGALIYLISPIDLVPDFIIGLGFGDDLAVIAWAFAKLSLELKRYVAWRRDQGNPVQDTPFQEDLVEEDFKEYKINEEEWIYDPEDDLTGQEDEVQYRVSEDDL